MSGDKPILSIACPSCKHENLPKGRTLTRALTCVKCKSYFRLFLKADEKFAKFKESHEPALSVGTKGKINGITYQVMGFTVKREKYSYKWREYLLFNPFHGGAYLSEYDGHWNFITSHIGNPTQGSRDFTFYHDNNPYRLYQKYSPRVLYAEGEFFIDEVYISEDSNVAEYISPPHSFISQFTDNRYEWLKGEYIDGKTVAEGFKIPSEKMPKKTGFGYTQPIIRSFSESNLFTAIFAVVIFLVAIQGYFQTEATHEKVFSRTYYKKDLTQQKMFSTESFLLEGGTKSVQIEIQAPIDNDWFYADFSLIEESNGTEHEFSKEVEYYHGVDGGDSWSEGSTRGEAFLSRIPEGRYHINIYPQFSFNSEYFAIEVYRNEPIYSNFFVSLLLLALFPIFYFVRRYYKEKKRWSDSDYSPYETDEE
jgi:hypothetical protein